METVVVAALVIAVVLFGMLTLAQGYLSAQSEILESWRAMNERALERTRTGLRPVGGAMGATGDVVELTVRNDGSVRLADFARWDVVLEYMGPTARMARWYPYVDAPDPGLDQWTVAGIYLDAAAGQPEVYNPGILDPGEEMVIRVKVSPPVKVGSSNMAIIGTPSGVSTSVFFAS